MAAQLLTSKPVFTRLLKFIDSWTTLHSILDLCQHTRQSFYDYNSLILARFIPGFSPSNIKSNIYISIYHLHLFIISQSYPLQFYPALALRSPTDTQPLASLALAHSRIVLFLQSIVYSSPNITLPPEPPSSFIDPVLPELTFPAPLSYSSDSPSSCPTTPTKKQQPPLALFKSRDRLALPPASEPRVLKAYSLSWRRSLIPFEYDHVPSRCSTPTPPSSTSSSSPSLCQYPIHSPHDWAYATSPTRAPVLRVYAPCSTSSTSPSIIINVEDQLIAAGLWDHLSVGDIVCNLGHVPLSDPDPLYASDPDWLQHPQSPPAPTWLIFNGSILVPFIPSHSPLVPVQDPLALPSPFYYTHILPRTVNPIYTLNRMPHFHSIPQSQRRRSANSPLRTPSDVHIRLVYLPTKVPTSHRPGYALVRRYMWIARVFVTDVQPEVEVGLGWCGEWVLEGEGTREGKEMLLHWILHAGEKEGQWELVRERCAPGRIWLKLL